MAMVISRFEVYLVRLDPTEGHEIHKTRPRLVISPDEMNHHIDTIIVAPMYGEGDERRTAGLTLPRYYRDSQLGQTLTHSATRASSAYSTWP